MIITALLAFFSNLDRSDIDHNKELNDSRPLAGNAPNLTLEMGKQREDLSVRLNKENVDGGLRISVFGGTDKTDAASKQPTKNFEMLRIKTEDEARAAVTAKEGFFFVIVFNLAWLLLLLKQL